MGTKRKEPETAVIRSSTHDGRGIAELPGKTVFVAGALAGERVRFQRRKRRRNYDEAELLEVLEPSGERVSPRCDVFGRCGGCAMQHLSPDGQRALKQQALLDNLERIGGVRPEEVFEPLVGQNEWNYRRRARLAVKDVPMKGRVLVGFRERHAPFITDMRRCEVLGDPVDALLMPLSDLIGALSIRHRLPQIEVAIADNAIELVLRVLDPPTGDDRARMEAFASEHGLRLSLQPGGPKTVEALAPKSGGEPLYYTLDEFDVRVEFRATDFVQVNRSVNERMVGRAIELLDVGPSHRVLDLYCGIGNFTLPLARRARSVTGIEFEAEQVAQARHNAALNKLTNTEFLAADLSVLDGEEGWLQPQWDRLLLDPARSGAEAVVRHIDRLSVNKIVYVSCNPGTLARDAKSLVGDSGYCLRAAGIIDMFPHTAHVESIAVFEKQ